MTARIILITPLSFALLCPVIVGMSTYNYSFGQGGPFGGAGNFGKVNSLLGMDSSMVGFAQANVSLCDMGD